VSISNDVVLKQLATWDLGSGSYHGDFKQTRGDTPRKLIM